MQLDDEQIALLKEMCEIHSVDSFSLGIKYFFFKKDILTSLKFLREKYKFEDIKHSVIYLIQLIIVKDRLSMQYKEMDETRTKIVKDIIKLKEFNNKIFIKNHTLMKAKNDKMLNLFSDYLSENIPTRIIFQN